ncbi:type I-C CRISPR-associated protein Cas7/Csd2 [Lacticaseibacillus daqingensis]|uniref:type I-C CRISPR-associated protein Cas7/Csd2 n=1 Tax=Lacticaseibacillus daqingensis TaxID=2486014 RepID=UPI0013DDD211|nr:type I-C CRISPR-associated protein Cas7/Csd2 [Lacticaseibacillus daqingensis]
MSNVLAHKVDFTVVIGVKNANPNGDPLDSNRPRVNSDGLGEISDVAIKRKIRNRWQDMNLPVLVESQDRIPVGEPTNLRDRLKASEQVQKVLAGVTKKQPVDRYALMAAANASWIDVRAFGQVLPFKSGSNDGLDGVSIPLRGPVSIQAAYSTDPIVIREEQITKSINLEPGSAKGSDTMGTKAVVPFGVYVFNGSINIELAQKSGFTQEDAAALKEALRTLFVNDSSAARPEGSMAVIKLIWWEHDSQLGQLAPYLVHGATKVKNPVAIQKGELFADDQGRYQDADFTKVEVSVEDPNIEGLHVEVIDGF